jgi:DNA-binding MarR family transcriptional regulator
LAELPLVAEWQRVTHRLLAALEDELPGLGLTPGEVNALICFGDDRALAVRELVSATGQRKSTLTGVLDRLERRGLITREPDPADRRALRAVLTAEGGRAAAAVAEAFAAVEARVPYAGTLRKVLADVDAALD